MPLKPKRVVIIGAGICGLSCARELSKYKNEIDLVLLEASDRIGGRVNSFTAEDGTVLELGAQYIHGTIGNPIYDFAVEKGLIQEENEWVPHEIIKLFDKYIDASQQEKDLATQLGLDFESELWDNIKEIPYHDLNNMKSVGQYAKIEFDKFRSNCTGIINRCLESVFNHATINEAGFNGVGRLDDLGIESYWKYVDLPGFKHFSSFGCYSKIVAAIYDDVSNDVLKLNHKVNKIEFKEDMGLSITCENGKFFECDFIVITVSLELLKRWIQQDDIFNPPLPSEKSKALTHMKLSRTTKVFFKFKSPCSLRKEVHNFQFYPSMKCLENNAYCTITSFNRVGSSDWWMIWVNGLLFDEYEKSSDNVDFLQTCFKTIKDCYPQFPQDLEIDSDYVLSHDWPNDPLYLGGWSYFGCGGDSGEDISTLRKPVVYESGDMKYHLIISGEITEENFYSTTHAAFESGIRDGKLIEKILKADPN